MIIQTEHPPRRALLVGSAVVEGVALADAGSGDAIASDGLGSIRHVRPHLRGRQGRPLRDVGTARALLVRNAHAAPGDFARTATTGNFS
jgi:hypothetical protein